MEPLPWYRVAVPMAFALGLVVVAWVSRSERLRFTAAGMLALVGYGAAQDQITARLCPEYFTVLHPPIPGLTDPTLLGLTWGFLGSWWGGCLFGYAAGVAATVGSRPPFPRRELARPVAVLLLCVAAATAFTGWNVAHHADLLGVASGDGRQAALIVACAHFAAYASAIVGSVLVCVWIGRSRRLRGRQ